jgi:hypothetical protein
MRKDKRKQKTSKKIVAAFAMFALSASMLGTATYAWFTMNKTVQVTGMEVKTKVGDNLLISTTNLDTDYTSQTLLQTRKALLEPVSSINGATDTFYYTVDAKADGDAVSDVYYKYAETGSGATAETNTLAAKSHYNDAFQTAYGVTLDSGASFTDAFQRAFGYVDYTFYIKATSSAANQKVVMSQCDLDYNGGVLETSGTLGKVDGPDRAWRVAVFAKDITGTNPGNGVYTTDDIAVATNQKGLIALANAQNQQAGEAVESTTSAAGTVLNNASSNGVVLGEITTANTTAYYKVVVRMWLEGEDNTCTSETYAKLTDAYKLDMEYKIVNSTDTTTAVKTISNNTFTPSSGTFTGDQYDSGASWQ